MSPRSPIIDCHVHLAGTGHGGSGCFIAPAKLRSPLFKLMSWKLGLSRALRAGRLDAAYLERLLKDVETARSHQALDAAVAFAHDRLYADDGTLHPRQELYVPNEYVFECARNSAGRLLPAASVHPYRKNALEEVERWIAAGAVALKWLPNSQNIDPGDKRCTAIYRLLARERVPLIAHTGGEHTVKVLRRELGNPACLRPALDEGVSVVAAHCATKSGVIDPDWLPQFFELARQHANFWGDTSALCTPGRARWIRRILAEEDVLAKLIHGSDFPVPPNAWVCFRRLGIRGVTKTGRLWSWLERDLAIKRACGFPEVVFTNGARVLRLEGYPALAAAASS